MSRCRPSSRSYGALRRTGFAERAVELTGSKSAYELAVLAQMRHVEGRHSDAVTLARQALGLVAATDDGSFYRDNLANYEAAAGAKR
jgi:hypothetical protein